MVYRENQLKSLSLRQKSVQNRVHFLAEIDHIFLCQSSFFGQNVPKKSKKMEAVVYSRLEKQPDGQLSYASVLNKPGYQLN